MSYFSKDEWDCESAVREQSVRAAESREEAILDVKAKLMKLSDEKLIDFVLKRGEAMNVLDITFKVYDVCKKLHDHGWAPKGKQRGAIINVAAIAVYNTGTDLEDLEDIVEVKALSHWETPKQWKRHKGKAWPDNAAVRILNPDGKWELMEYWRAKQLEQDLARLDKDFGDDPKEMLIVCDRGEAGPPPKDWRPEEENR
jgi:hypothetical protein